MLPPVGVKGGDVINGDFDIKNRRPPITGPGVFHVLEDQHEVAGLIVDIGVVAARRGNAGIFSELAIELDFRAIEAEPIEQCADRRMRSRKLDDDACRSRGSRRS
jgi:hypothetical protein